METVFWATILGLALALWFLWSISCAMNTTVCLLQRREPAWQPEIADRLEAIEKQLKELTYVVSDIEGRVALGARYPREVERDMRNAMHGL